MNAEQAVKELQLAMRKTKNRRLFERYQAILLHLNGKRAKEIAETIQRNPSTVYDYINAYKANGLEGLQMGYSPGKPPKLSAEQYALLAETIATKVPADVGFPATYNWTLSLMAQWVKKEWGVSYSIRGMSKVMERLGFSHTRPTYTLEKADAEKQRVFTEETFPALKKTNQ